MVAQARSGLQLLSRKIEGYGPEPGSDAAARAAAAAAMASLVRHGEAARLLAGPRLIMARERRQVTVEA